MARFSTLFVAVVSTTLCAVAATPVPSDNAALEKRATGRGTWFNVGLGACGFTDADSDPVVAISAAIYGNGGDCNKSITITNTANGQTATGQVRDKCPGCGANDIDMSPSLFQQLGSLDTGVLTVQWSLA